MYPSGLKVALSKRLKQMRDIAKRVAVLFVCGPGAGSLCTRSSAVSLSNRLWTETHGRLKGANLPAATEGLVVAA